MAMASRAGGLTDDVALARDISGYHAWMKVNEGQLLSGRMGQIYIQKRSFGKVDQARFDEGSNQIRDFDPDFRAFVSKPMQDRVDAFFASPDGKALTDIYAAMASLEDYKCKPELHDVFAEAAGERTQVITGFHREDDQSLIKGADARLNAVWFSMVFIISGVAGGSRKISDASDNLARRTEQQPASLEETAAALEQITANVTSTSHH